MASVLTKKVVRTVADTKTRISSAETRGTGARIGALPDPLGRDRDDDEVVVATRRAMCRVAVVAAETGSRFQREGVAHDPVAWMLAPRELFGGRAALDACLQLEDFRRAIILHGLGLGMDATPEAVDALAADDFEEPGWDGAPAARSRNSWPVVVHAIGAEVGGAAADHAGDGVGSDVSGPVASGGGGGGCGGGSDGGSDGGGEGMGALLTMGPRRLCSATAVIVRPDVNHVVFHASFARSASELRDFLRDRYGDGIAEAADVRVGFDAGHPLVPPVIARFLAEAERWDDKSIGVSVNFERRIAR